MTTHTLRDARAEVVRERVLSGVSALLEAGDDLTFANVARAADVPERTVYRHFATREALLAAVFEWANRRIGFEGELPTDRAGVVELIRRAFPGFDGISPVVRELLVAPEGRLARLARVDERQAAAVALVESEVPGLDPATARRVAAAVQLLTTAGTWSSLRDYWGMDGADAAETAALAVELVLDGAELSRRQTSPPVTLLAGLNHVAVMTDDLDRFVDFYTDVFAVDVVFEETTPAFRHAILRTGPDSWLHPAQVVGNAHGAGLPAMFERGHLDHIALTAASPRAFAELRERLVERGATTGEVEDLGAFHALWFHDPDGMRVELTVIVDHELGDIHAPRPVADASSS